MGFGFLFQLLIFVLFFAVLWWLLKESGSRKEDRKEDQPLGILKRRLAGGEITKKEFDELRHEVE